MTGLKSLYLLKQNIRALLDARGLDQKSLARYCGRSEAWISQILNNPGRGLEIRQLDRIADFFGVAPYQLFQPGVSHLAERRSGRERRSGADRRFNRSDEMLRPLPNFAEVERKVKGMSPEEFQRWLRRAFGAADLVDRPPTGTAPRDHADEAARRREPGTRIRGPRKRTPRESNDET